MKAGVRLFIVRRERVRGRWKLEEGRVVRLKVLQVNGD
jgi:hypothetical protein